MPLSISVDLFADALHADAAHWFRGRDKYSLSDKRRCLPLHAGETRTFAFEVAPADLAAGIGEVWLSGSLEVFDTHAYVHKFLNSLISLRLNETTIHDGIIHWRSHEESASFWPEFDFAFDMALLKPGLNTIELTNRTTRDALGDFFDPQLLEEFDEGTAERKLATLYLATVEVIHAKAPKRYPQFTGVPDAAVAGQPTIVEVSTGPAPATVEIEQSSNADVHALGAKFEFGEHRALFEVTPRTPGLPVQIGFAIEGEVLRHRIPAVYADRGGEALIIGPGAETTYWHRLKQAAQDFYERGFGNCFRISIDDFLANLHHVPLGEWMPLIRYLVRRRRHYALARIRVPHYSRIRQAELVELADLAPDLFAGMTIPEPVNHLHADLAEPDLAQRLAKYLSYFSDRMEETRLPGHPLVTFDSAGYLCGHYYQLGLDVQISEIGPSCNILEEIGCRGGARAHGKPWGVATAMHWYCGQGAQYAYDDSRVRYARLAMLHSYLAGARQILWEGGVWDNLPVYNFILSEESWRDFGRRYDDPRLWAVRDAFRQTLDYHRAQQLPQPRSRFGVLRGVNELSMNFDAGTSSFGDMSIARARTLLRVFLPHVLLRLPDRGRRIRRWYSATPYGQVDLVPAEVSAEHFGEYRLLALLGWNTMTPDLYRELVRYVEAGGRLFLSTAHLTNDTMQKLEWSFHNNGDVRELCGVCVRDLGGRVEDVVFRDDRFAAHLPRRVALSEKNPLFMDQFDEIYPVFERDVTCFLGEVEPDGADVLAVSQRGEPAVLRHRVGAGEVVLLNSYYHPGRGNLLKLAEGLLRTLADEVPAPLRLDDPQQVVSWFEYPDAGFERYIFVNTDWTREHAVAETTVTIADELIHLNLRPCHPVQIASDGELHLVLDDPAAQVTAWRNDAGRRTVTMVHGEPSALRGPAAGEARILRGD